MYNMTKNNKLGTKTEQKWLTLSGKVWFNSVRARKQLPKCLPKCQHSEAEMLKPPADVQGAQRYYVMQA